MLTYSYHAQERVMERFGVYLDKEGLSNIMERIINGDADYIGKGKRTSTIWMIEYEGQKLYPVVDFEEKFILTFLTKPMAYRTVKSNRKLAI